MITEAIKQINIKLADVYGRDLYSSKPKFKIVWSTDEYEKRYGTFDIYTDEGIFLRTETGIKEIEKYPIFPDWHILEVLKDNEFHSELKAKQSYEPLWRFIDKEGNRAEPIWPMVELIVKSYLNAITTVSKRTQKDIDAEENAKKAKEKALFKTILQNESPYLAGCLKDGVAVTVPRNFEREKVN